MALVKIEDRITKPAWNASTNNRAPILPKINDTPPPNLDYEKLQWLCSIEGLKGREHVQTTDEAHEFFMKNYQKIFVKPQKKVGLPIHTAKRTDQKSTVSNTTQKATGKTTEADKTNRIQYPIDTITHDIRDYLPLLHKQRKSEHPEAIYRDNLRTLRKLLKKLPFERTASENDRIFSILGTFEFFKQKFTPGVLKELCVVAVSESWKDTGFTIFGNNGLFMILKGTAISLGSPHLDHIENVVDSLSSTPKASPRTQQTNTSTGSGVVINVGECFGTLKKQKQQEEGLEGFKPFSVLTNEPNCEFMKISASDYNRIIEQIKQREHTEKINLLLSCGQYKLWPRQPLLRVAELIEWTSCPPNTIIASEGYKAPYIGFIKSGECHVLRQVDVIVTKHGRRERRTKQVVMGKLHASESFAEISVLLDEPVTCSIVSATNVDLGVIRPERIEELDEVTIQLFTQSNEPTFGKLTKDNIQDEYMQQELKREWNEFKHGVVVEVINAKGIRPGYGKWSK